MIGNARRFVPLGLALALADGRVQTAEIGDGSLRQPTPAASAPASAQLPGSPQGALPRTTQGLTLEIERFLKRLVATYQEAQSYRDRGRVTLMQQSGRVKMTTEMPMELTFQRPNLLRLDAGQYTAASDGKKLYFVIPELRQYTTAPAPEKLEKKHLHARSILGGTDEGHPELIDFL